jgi:hypothetical protein
VSTDGKDPAVDAVLRDAQRLVSAAAREQQQLELADPLTADEIFEAQEELGFGAGTIAVMRQARKKRAGRPKGRLNRRSDDFVRYIAQFGQDPAITLMQIQTTPPEELVARSHMLDPVKRRMSYADAQSLRARCAEGLMPYFHSKKPLAVDLGLNGDFNLLIPGLNITEADAAAAGAGQFMLEGDYVDVEPAAPEEAGETND